MSLSKPLPKHVFSLDYTELEQGRSVLLTEADALRALANHLNEDFLRALQICSSLKGRVVVSGIGKSGHIARKIAATLSSTGQPSFFVHPAEASHGDLGMITKDDVLLVLSNSGETVELSGLIHYTRRFSIPLIAVTSNSESSLAQCADVHLTLPPEREACPMGLAPTTSTIMMLALGDALAVTLLSKRRFSPKDFHVFHPGGNLGQSLLKVQEKMHSGDKMPLAHQDQSMAEVLKVMSDKGFGCAGLVNDEGDLVGLITDGDLRRHLSPNLLEQKAKEIMTPNPITIEPTALMAHALALLQSRSITNLFVVEMREEPMGREIVSRQKPCGLLHVHDFLRHGIL